MSNFGSMHYDGRHTAEIVKVDGVWCMQKWPVSYLKGEAKKLGIHRTASNNSMNGRRYTPEHIQAAVDFVPPKEDGQPVFVCGVSGPIDCTCGQRGWVTDNKATCWFCGQEWTASVTLVATHPFDATEADER